MARREWPLSFRCGHPDCNETVTYRYSTLRDRKDSFEMRCYSPDKWRCTRHSRPDEVLSESNPSTEAVLVVNQGTHGLYFGKQGLVFGPGFKAFAKDFPPGTRLIVTARIELPSNENNNKEST